MAVDKNHVLLQMDEKSCMDSIIRFYVALLLLFRETHSGLVLKQHLIVLGDGRDEDDGLDVVEAVNPLTSLRSLSSHIEHSEDRFLIASRR